MSEKFSSKRAFIMSCVGSAVGLGNLFRFPALCIKYGGVFIPVYICLMLLLGLPMLYFELLLGRQGGGSAPKAFGLLAPKGRLVGRLCCFNSFLTLCCYGLLFSFVLASVFFSFSFFFAGTRDTALIFSSLVAPDQFSPLALVFLLGGWGLVLLCFGSVERIGKLSTVGMTLSAIILMGLALFSAITHPAALLSLFKPSLSPLLTLAFWADTAGQVFFSLSLAVGVMVTYGSFLDKKESLLSSSLIILFFDLGVSLAATVIFTSFSVSPKNNLLSSFSVYPLAFSSLGSLGGLLSLLFFLCLAFLCLDSVIAYLKAVTVGLSDRISAKEGHLALLFSLPAIGIGIIILSFNLLPYFDGRIIPLLSLTVGLLEAMLFSFGIKGSALPVKNRFFLLSARFFLPPILFFLFFCEIFY